MADSLANLNQLLKQFASDRNWEQFHNPKNLAMALSVEAGELMEHFQWLDFDQAANLDAVKLRQVELELADIQIYLIRLAEVLQIDLIQVSNDKIKINQQRFPIDEYTNRHSKE